MATDISVARLLIDEVLISPFESDELVDINILKLALVRTSGGRRRARRCRRKDWSATRFL
jgi:hypothetical protein